MRRPGPAAALACVAVALGGALAAGCGGDDDSPTTTPTIEPATPTGASGPTGKAGEREGKPRGKKGSTDLENGAVTPPPEVDPDAAEPPVDSPENDIPPEPGSAAESFEKYCDENPQACG